MMAAMIGLKTETIIAIIFFCFSLFVKGKVNRVDLKIGP